MLPYMITMPTPIAGEQLVLYNIILYNFNSLIWDLFLSTKVDNMLEKNILNEQ